MDSLIKSCVLDTVPILFHGKEGRLRMAQKFAQGHTMDAL